MVYKSCKQVCIFEFDRKLLTIMLINSLSPKHANIIFYAFLMKIRMEEFFISDST